VQGCAIVAWALKEAEPAKAVKMPLPVGVVERVCGFLGADELKSLTGRGKGESAI
jgi:hypothetical protein